MSDDVLKAIGKRMGDLDDLPEELRMQLQISKLDDLEEKVIKVLDELYEGYANIDEVLVGLYRKFGDLQKRAYLANKLYRMSQAKLIYSVSGKKGAYSTQKQTAGVRFI